MLTKFLLAAALLEVVKSGDYSSFEFCIPLPIRWGDYHPTPKIFKPGSTITYRCTSGYQLVGDASSTCVGNSWDKPYPRCVRTVKCKRPQQPGYGYIIPQNVRSFDVGATITYRCSNDYQLDGDEVHTCQSNGHWNYPEPKCLTYRCQPPKFNYEYVTYSPRKSVYDIDDVIYFSCSNGYTLSGDNSATCLLGGVWTSYSSTSRTPKCSKHCAQPPPIVYGSFSPRQDSYRPGQSVTYSCSGNRKVQGSSWIRCNDNGQWPTYLPVCGDPVCARPERPKGGSYFPSRSYYQPGSKVQFSCGTHFVEGPKFITCLSSGHWSGFVPRCVVPYCRKPNNPENGYFGPIHDRYKNDEGVWFKCKFPYVIAGQKDIHCVKGRWSHPEPQCALPRCPLPRAIQNGGYRVYNQHFPQGYIPHQLYPIGIKIEYYCNAPFALKGPAVNTCNQGGSWSRHQPTCERGCDRPVIGEIGFVMPPKQHFAPGEQAWIKCPVGLIAKPERDIVCVGYKNWSQNHVRCVTEGTCKGRCNEQNSGNSCYCDATLCNNYPNRCCSDFRESCFGSIHYYH